MGVLWVMVFLGHALKRLQDICLRHWQYWKSHGNQFLGPEVDPEGLQIVRNLSDVADMADVAHVMTWSWAAWHVRAKGEYRLTCVWCVIIFDLASLSIFALFVSGFCCTFIHKDMDHGVNNMGRASVDLYGCKWLSICHSCPRQGWLEPFNMDMCYMYRSGQTPEFRIMRVCYSSDNCPRWGSCRGKHGIYRKCKIYLHVSWQALLQRIVGFGVFGAAEARVYIWPRRSRFGCSHDAAWTWTCDHSSWKVACQLTLLTWHRILLHTFWDGCCVPLWSWIWAMWNMKCVIGIKHS